MGGEVKLLDINFPAETHREDGPQRGAANRAVHAVKGGDEGAERSGPLHSRWPVLVSSLARTAVGWDEALLTECGRCGRHVCDCYDKDM